MGRGFTPMVALVVAIVCGACVIAAAAWWARHEDQAAIRERENLIASDMVESIDRILDNVTSRRKQELSALPGQPCPNVELRLSELETYVQYVRSVNLVESQRLYCSSVIGRVDVPAHRGYGRNLLEGVQNVGIAHVAKVQNVLHVL